MLRLFLLLVLTCGTSLPLPSQQLVMWHGGDICSPEDRPYHLVFEENFDGQSLDSKVWQTYLPCSNAEDDQCLWARTHCTEADCNEAQIFRDENVTVADGLCSIAVSKQKNSWKGVERKYTSGMIYSKEAFKKYGRYEIRCDMPHGDAYWPAFWMFGWSAEIDVAEYGGKINEYAVGVHKWGDRGSIDPFIEKVTSPKALTKGMHVYAVEYDPYRLRFYLDGDLVSTMHKYSTLTGQPVTECSYLRPQVLVEHYAYPRAASPLHIIVNVALWYWADRRRYKFVADNLLIDYIRYYERDYPCGYAPEVMNVDEDHTITLPRTLRKVQVAAGATLTLSDGAYYFEGDGGIEVMDSSRLVLQNATLTACDPDIPWRGIQLHEDGTLLGSNSTITQAATGLTLPTVGETSQLHISGDLTIDHCGTGIYAPDTTVLRRIQDTLLVADCSAAVRTSDTIDLDKTALHFVTNTESKAPTVHDRVPLLSPQNDVPTWQLLLADMDERQMTNQEQYEMAHDTRPSLTSHQLKLAAVELLVRMRARL